MERCRREGGEDATRQVERRSRGGQELSRWQRKAGARGGTRGRRRRRGGELAGFLTSHETRRVYWHCEEARDGHGE